MSKIPSEVHNSIQVKGSDFTIVPIVAIIGFTLDNVLAFVALWLEDNFLVSLQVPKHFQLGAFCQNIGFHNLNNVRARRKNLSHTFEVVRDFSMAPID